jgi:hypothetical protein
MWKNLSLTSFGQGPAGTARTCWTTVKLAWKACPVLLVGVLLLFGVESGLTPLQLALSRAVIDKLAAPLGHTAVLDSLVTHVSLTAWIVLTLTVMTLGQLISPLTALLQSQASDRLSGYVTEQVMQVWLLKWLVDVLSAPLSLTGGYAGVLGGDRAEGRPLSLSGRKPGQRGAPGDERATPGGESDRAGGRQRSREEHAGQAADAHVRSCKRPDRA